MIEINVTDDAVLQALQEAQQRSDNLEPAYKSIGEMLVVSTQQRFRDKKDPEGHPWAELSDVTIFRKGHARQLEGESRQLARQIVYEVDRKGVEVGSPLEYAAMMHFGGKKAEFSHLWGDIPARTFVGVSADDRDRIIEILQDLLAG
ncbi:phage virion morphogenesis protein [Terasakiispira papahanaumokuakeensis]|uniref:Phage virion morphogenesis protein n=1 Tax=Terasakiispira papahanaumokuakeensis TaxID=197479 RepID=A0A1E2V891_9GAMM|nr:phage virion morphogenesis protein [Terasakiispira papahanaumokuakeensis]ODC03230.1 phage virion morphogenesis protein [Terasakiispira papahanaumokuakeensis]